MDIFHCGRYATSAEDAMIVCILCLWVGPLADGYAILSIVTGCIGRQGSCCPVGVFTRQNASLGYSSLGFPACEATYEYHPLFSKL